MSEHLSVGDRVRRIKITIPSRQAPPEMTANDRRILLGIRSGSVKHERDGWAYEAGDPIPTACIRRLVTAGYASLSVRNGRRTVTLTALGTAKIA